MFWLQEHLLLRLFILTFGGLTCLMPNVSLNRVLSRALSALVLCEYLSPFASFTWLVPGLSFPARISNPIWSSLHDVSMELLLFAMLPKYHVSLAGWCNPSILLVHGKTYLKSPSQSVGSFNSWYIRKCAFKTGSIQHSVDPSCIKSALI